MLVAVTVALILSHKASMVEKRVEFLEIKIHIKAEAKGYNLQFYCKKIFAFVALVYQAKETN